MTVALKISKLFICSPNRVQLFSLPPHIMLKKALTHSDRSKDRSLEITQ